MRRDEINQGRDGVASLPVFHFRRFLAALAAPGAVPVVDGGTREMPRNGTFRVLHVKRR